MAQHLKVSGSFDPLGSESGTRTPSYRFAGLISLYIIIGLNVLIYVDMATAFDNSSFSAHQVALYGTANFGPYWESLGSNYMHFSLEHIAFNMMALAIWGGAVSRRMGFIKFVLFYTSCGVCASIVSVASHPGTVSAGASGAISGVLAALFVLKLFGEKSLEFGNLISVVIFNSVYAVISPTIDWQAHLGGFVAGIFLAIIFVPRYLFLALASTVVVTAIFLALRHP